MDNYQVFNAHHPTDDLVLRELLQQQLQCNGNPEYEVCELLFGLLNSIQVNSSDINLAVVDLENKKDIHTPISTSEHAEEISKKRSYDLASSISPLPPSLITSKCVSRRE